MPVFYFINLLACVSVYVCVYTITLPWLHNILHSLFWLAFQSQDN